MKSREWEALSFRLYGCAEADREPFNADGNAYAACRELERDSNLELVASWHRLAIPRGPIVVASQFSLGATSVFRVRVQALSLGQQSWGLTDWELACWHEAHRHCAALVQSVTSEAVRARWDGACGSFWAKLTSEWGVTDVRIPYGFALSMGLVGHMNVV